jgi:hypothetical protein
MASDPVVEALIRAGARQRGLDERAVIAVALGEGGLRNRRNDIGDLAGGGSYGPFQLYAQGALPRQFRGSPRAADAWAWSPAGINYALNQIAKVARGQRGRPAIEAIVRRFERPAAPGASIAKAWGRYGQVGGGGGAMSARSPAAEMAGVPSPPPAASPDLAGLFNLTRSIVGLPERTVPLTMSQPSALGANAPPKRPYTRMQQPNLAGPKLKRGKTIDFLTHFAKPFGVTVTSTTGGRHVKNSWHYKGRAVDVGGDPRRMAAVARAALQHPQDFVEMFYTGPGHPGFYIKNGKALPLSQLDRSVYDNHGDHVHLAA